MKYMYLLIVITIIGIFVFRMAVKEITFKMSYKFLNPALVMDNQQKYLNI